jgi:hypothetical protein
MNWGMRGKKGDYPVRDPSLSPIALSGYSPWKLDITGYCSDNRTIVCQKLKARFKVGGKPRIISVKKCANTPVGMCNSRISGRAGAAILLLYDTYALV